MDEKKWLVFIDDLERAVEDPARVFTDDKKDFDKNNKNNAPFERAKRDMGATHPAATPNAVVQITSTTEAQNIVNLCRRRRVPVVPRGADHWIRRRVRGVFRRRRYRHGADEIDVARSDATHGDRRRGRVEERIERVFGTARVYFWTRSRHARTRLAPTRTSRDGSTGGSGLSTLKYGTSKENIVSMKKSSRRKETSSKTRRNVRKNSTGVRFNALYLSARRYFGGVITELTVKLFPIPKTRVGAVVQFETVKDAAETVVLARNANLETLLRCEMLNAEGVQVSNVVFKAKMIEDARCF